MAGVAGLPAASNFNRCDSKTAPRCPAETPANPRECRTFSPLTLVPKHNEIQRLRDRIEELEAILGMAEDHVTVIMRVTGLPYYPSCILGILHRRNTVFSKEVIGQLVYGYRPECDQPEHVIKIIEVFVHTIRKKIAPLGLSIRTVFQQGYTMDDADRRRLTAMMRAPTPCEAQVVPFRSYRDSTVNFGEHHAKI